MVKIGQISGGAVIVNGIGRINRNVAHQEAVSKCKISTFQTRAEQDQFLYDILVSRNEDNLSDYKTSADDSGIVTLRFNDEILKEVLATFDEDELYK
jgi:hypothetical protein